MVGEGQAVNGAFEITIVIPEDMQLGSYQAPAHAIETEECEESWSDPEIGVYVNSEMKLRGQVGSH